MEFPYRNKILNYTIIPKIINCNPMKTLNYLFLILSFISVTGCKKDGNSLNNPAVESYVRLLKSNQYESSKLPHFTDEHIPALLKYRDEKQLITKFPRNLISSMYSGECKLGMYVLWTIEAIRSESISSSKTDMQQFPSQNSILKLRDATSLSLVSDDVSHDIAAKAYYDWWENNKNKNFDDVKDVDPLKDTNYRWH